MRPRKRPRVELSDDRDQPDGISTDDTESEQAAQSADSREHSNGGTFNVRDRIGVAIGRRDRMERIVNRRNSEETSRLHSFRSFGISPALLAVLSGMSITTPTEIQAACIPYILAGECISFID
jgi:ATP-dependent RNA helicase DDX49/DBP8